MFTLRSLSRGVNPVERGDIRWVSLYRLFARLTHSYTDRGDVSDYGGAGFSTNCGDDDSLDAFVRSAPLNECRSRSNSVRGDLQSGFGGDDDLGIVLFPLSRRRRRQSFCHEEERQDDDERGLQLRIDKEKTI